MKLYKKMANDYFETNFKELRVTADNPLDQKYADVALKFLKKNYVDTYAAGFKTAKEMIVEYMEKSLLVSPYRASLNEIKLIGEEKAE